jgi:hypothetical protein
MNANGDIESPGEKPTESTSVKPSPFHGALKKLTRRDLPLALSVVAVIISLLTYIDQHNADRNAAIASAETDAAKVSFWLVSSKVPGQLPEVIVQNDGVLPISNVEITLQAMGIPFVNPPGTEVYLINFIEDTLPPCSEYKAPILEDATIRMRNFQQSHHDIPAPPKGTSWKFGNYSLEFTDASGLTWTRSGTGALTQSVSGQPGDSQTLSVPAPNGLTTTDAPGCS